MNLSFDEATHSYFIDGRPVPGITSIIKDLGIGADHTHTDPVHSLRGRAVHRAIELYDQGTLDETSVDPAIRPYFNAYLKFLDDTGFRPVYHELRLGHDTLSFAGTLDKVGYIGGALGILEIKTTEAVDLKALRAQLAAQSVLWRRNYPKRPIRWKYGLQLRKDGTPNLITKLSVLSDTYWISLLNQRKEAA